MLLFFEYEGVGIDGVFYDVVVIEFYDFVCDGVVEVVVCEDGFD